MAEKIHDVPIKHIRDVAKTGLNVRRTDRDSAVEGLAKSIKKHTLLQAIVLRGEFGKPPYDLIAGHRRLAAHHHLGRKSIEVRFRPAATICMVNILSGCYNEFTSYF